MGRKKYSRRQFSNKFEHNDDFHACVKFVACKPHIAEATD